MYTEILSIENMVDLTPKKVKTFFNHFNMKISGGNVMAKRIKINWDKNRTHPYPWHA
jgi:hypothetical protein